MLLDNAFKKQRDSKFNWLGGGYLRCGPHLSMIFGNQGQLGRRTMQKGCISGLYFLNTFLLMFLGFLASTSKEGIQQYRFFSWSR